MFNKRLLAKSLFIALCFTFLPLSATEPLSEFLPDTLIIYPDTTEGQRYDSYSAIVLKGRVVTMEKDRKGAIRIIKNGRVVIVGEKIVAVLSQNEQLPADIDPDSIIILDTNGLIFPGLINAHDHVHYNYIPLWDCPKIYKNRYQWPNTKECKINIKYPKNIVTQNKYWGLTAEAVKYSEVKQLISGTTAVQGSPNASKKFCRILVRNMDVSKNFGINKMSPYVRPVKNVKDEKIKKWLDKMNADELDALFFHIAEGVDEKSRSEFDFLVEKGLDRKETILIHGTALDEEQIKHAAEKNMTVVWSPTSNLLLYGVTADIPTMVKYGVNICLGTDWSPSGGKNLLGEMKIAYEYNKAKFNGILSYQDIVEMVTINPADAVGWTDYVGRIKPGLYADIMVINDPGGNPFEALVKATERDVSLVLIGGDPLYGDSIYMSQLKPGDFEYLKTTCGFTKCLDFTKEGVELGEQTFRQIVDTLELVMSFDTTAMKQAFSDEDISKYNSFADYMNEKFPGYKPIHLDPLYPCMDPYFFEVLRTSRNASLPFDIEAVYYSSSK